MVRYVTPVPPRAATGQVARVYAQLAGEFGFHTPALTALSPAPDLLAATWAVLRESQLAGEAPRAGKEVVAVGVSLANRCPFCVDAHTMMLHATGEHRLAETIARGGTPADPEHARLLTWAQATGTPEVTVPPFPSRLAAEYVGTALGYHFVNRMVSALQGEDVLPGGLQKQPVVRRLAGRVFARAVRRRLTPGNSLPLLSGFPVAPRPPWGAGTPAGTAYAALRTAADAGRAVLSHEAEAVLRDAVNAWGGGHPPLGGEWLTGPLGVLPVADRPAARLALLAALAPYRITDADVAAWRTAGRTDADLVRLLGFGAITAVARIETRVTTSRRITAA